MHACMSMYTRNSDVCLFRRDPFFPCIWIYDITLGSRLEGIAGTGDCNLAIPMKNDLDAYHVHAN